MSKWTLDQEKAIFTPTGDGNIIVSAAAGSGKTAVLVERVIQKLLRGESIDRLLIVTFTNAAAAEMRERIVSRLISALEENTDTKLCRHLKRQVALSESADIMTIDSFCIHAVQNNFHVLGTDPDVGIADDGLAELMKAEAMERLMTSLYKTKNDEERNRFLRLTEAYSSNRDDRGLERLILELHKFVTPFAEPEKWLDRAVEAYKMPIERSPYVKHTFNMVIRAAKKCVEAIEELEITDEAAARYADWLKSVALAVAGAESEDEIVDICKNRITVKVYKGKLKYIVPQMDTISNDHPIYGSLMYIRAAFEEKLNSGIRYKLADLREFFKNSDQLAAEAEDIVWIVKRFMKKYAFIKDRRGVREFSDFEHMTYTLFSQHEDIRESYKAKYDEILIDEYQDTNELQDCVFGLISANNIFMVGDLKQSIYRFRGGDPYIFKKKNELYGTEGTNHKKITLAQNFRSRTEVLSSVNDIFSCIMSEESGDVDYKGDELIVRDSERDYYPKSESDCRAELHYISCPQASGERKRREVIFTVNKIKEILDSGVKVYDKETGRLRPIRKKDIVILENTTKFNGAMLVSELAKLGIDAYCDTKMFFNRREIKVMLALISLINNMRQDIPLITVMRSPIGGFTDNELALIRIRIRKSEDFLTALAEFTKKRVYKLYERSRRFKRTGKLSRIKTHKQLADRIRRFLADIRRWRGYVRRKSVAQLIWAIYEETYFYDIMGAIEHGEEAQFNLRLLYERAKQYEKAGFKGLFNFIKYIGLIEDSSEDIEGAKIVGENHDVVRIMTIHKSKGLEFPYVFLINAGSQFGPGRDSADIKKHKELMIGVRDISRSDHYTRDTLFYELIGETENREIRAERMRLAYVALTRAREKLHVVICAKEEADTLADDIVTKYTQPLVGGKMLPVDALSVKGMYGWLCPAAFVSGNTWKCSFYNAAEEDETADAQQQTEEFAPSEELKRSVYSILDYRYPYTKSNTIPSRTSVTQLKELDIERESLDAPVYEPNSRRSSGSGDMAELMFSPLHQKPAFMREEGKKAANEIGTLYHNIMAEIDTGRILKEGSECVESEINRLITDKKIASADMEYINMDKIKEFFESPIGKRMIKSSEIHREAPFQINISAVDYDPSLSVEIYGEEQVILQGIIDCFFKEGDRYILLDYKTDHIKNNKEQIRRKYQKQLELYKRAIETLTGGKVGEMYLYLFDSGETI